MAAPHQAHDSESGHHREQLPPAFRARLVAWDVVLTVAMLVMLIVVATATTVPSRFFGFLADVCADDSCTPAPYGINYYIYPVVWGGVGAAVAAAVIGPLVSLVKGWYLFYWPLLAATLICLSSLIGSMLTTFSQQYSPT